jgi:hypothetical protein
MPSLGAARLAADVSVSREAIGRIKQLLLLGRRDDAVALYEGEAHCDPKTADATVHGYTLDAVWSAIARMVRLSAGEMVISVGCALLLASGIALGVSNQVSRAHAAWMVGFGLAWLLSQHRELLRTVRYFFATAGTATVVRFGVVGKTAGKTVLRLLLDVREPSGSTFRVETSAVIDEADEKTVEVGHGVRVRYFRRDPGSVLYDGELSA